MGCCLGYRRRPPAIVKARLYPRQSLSSLRRCFNRRSFCTLFSYGRANGLFAKQPAKYLWTHEQQSLLSFLQPMRPLALSWC
jgi:hypothetical protein